MANRYESEDRWRRDRSRRGYGRQEEQFQSGRGYGDDPEYGQMGEGWRSEYGEQQSGWQSDRDERWRRERGDPGHQHWDSERFGTSGYGPARYTSEGRGFRSFTGSDQAGRDFAGGPGTYGYERSPVGGARAYGRGSYSAGSWDAGSYGAGSQLAANRGEWREGYGATPSSENRDYRGTWGGDQSGRGWLDRASDTVAGWFGSDEDENRRSRERGYRGRGPANYTRSDDRILEDACDALTDDPAVDAANIQVTVENGELTLDGTVPSREQKRRAEDCVEDLSGVKHVQNNLRVQERSTWDRNNSGEASGSQSNPTTESV